MSCLRKIIYESVTPSLPLDSLQLFSPQQYFTVWSELTWWKSILGCTHYLWHAHIRTVILWETLSVHVLAIKHHFSSASLSELWHLIECVGPNSDWFIKTLKTFVSFNDLLTFTFFPPWFLLIPIAFTIKFLFHLNYIYNVLLTYTFIV